MASNEIERLKQVYRFYRNDKAIQKRWDANQPGNRFNLSQREKLLIRLLEKNGCFPLHDKKFLDIGCNKGDLLARLNAYGAKEDNLCGVDILQERIAEGKREHPQMTLQCTNAEHLDFSDGFFDVVLFFTVFSSVLDDSTARNLAREATRVLRTGGLVIIYDIRWRNVLNPHVRPVSRRAIQRYFENAPMQVYSLTLILQLARFLAPFSVRLCFLLEKIPLLRSHYFIIINR